MTDWLPLVQNNIKSQSIVVEENAAQTKPVKSYHILTAQ